MKKVTTELVSRRGKTVVYYRDSNGKFRRRTFRSSFVFDEFVRDFRDSVLVDKIVSTFIYTYKHSSFDVDNIEDD